MRMASGNDAPVVAIDAGRLRGAWKNKGEVAVFRGVPYAAPPVGPRRWRKPEPFPAWDGVRDALKDGPIAIQRATMIETFLDALVRGQGWSRPRVVATKGLIAVAARPKQAEDCLYLTVRTPQLDPAAAMPVMVWIHGGDHQDGSGTDPYFASNTLARHGVVTVAINYRLGLMGYYAHPELADESDNGLAGNYGTLDQIAALEWVRDNIAAFGGDPSNVTVFGESAGGESVMHLMTSPLARGLLHRAVAQSPANSGQMIHLREPFLDYDSAEATSLAFARALGLTGGRQIARLRAMSTDEMYALVRAAPRLGDHYPAIDGHILPDSPLVAFARGQQAQVPLLIGSNGDEGTLILPTLGAPMVEYRRRPLPSDRLQYEIAAAFGDDLSGLLELYPGLHRRDRASEIAFCGDHMFGARAFWYARHHQATGQPTWLYHFTRTPPGRRQTAGAFHAAEIPFVHGSNLPIFPMTDADKRLGVEMQRHWTAFAMTGDPNSSESSAAWPSFTPDNPVWMRFDHVIRAEPVDRLARYEILNARTSRLVQEMAALAH